MEAKALERSESAPLIAPALSLQQSGALGGLSSPPSALPPTVVPRGTIVLTHGHHAECGVLMQPIASVSAYLKTRKPVMYWEDEEPLFVTLPGEIRLNVKSMQARAELVLSLVKARFKVRPAVKSALATFKDYHWHPTTFRTIYDKWVTSKDWTAFVNRSKAGADWQEVRAGLPDEFLEFCAGRIGRYKRDDSRKEALRSVARQWRTGKNLEGEREPIPGYGFATDWFRKNFPGKVMPVEMPLPQGWSYSNIMRQIKACNTLPEAVRLMLLQGTAAAKPALPSTLGTRAPLRFLEEVAFDDVKTDWRVFDPKTGEPMDLWLLIARDRATGMLLGFGTRPARVREDGSQEHLKLRDMKQLCGWILERYGLPPYLMTWVIENGTATLSKGSVAALQEMLGSDRIHMRFGTMVGGISASGFKERRTGNSTSKASLESHNRTVHIIGAHLPGQTGPSYAKRPADLKDREDACREIVLSSFRLPEHLRDELGYPLLTLKQARATLFDIFQIQNTRTDHEMEGFDEVLEWYDEQTGRWMLSGVSPVGAKIRQRMESPIERALRLTAGLAWDRVSPEIITAFYQHTQRPVRIEPSGEIQFRHEKMLLKFVSPISGPKGLPSNPAKLLAYFNADDPAFLYLTDGKSRIVGVWLQRARVADKDAVAQAIAYQQRAMRAAREAADELAAPERARLEAMRSHNAQLLDANGFVEVARIDAPVASEVTSPVAAGIRGVKRQRAEIAEAKAEREASEAALVSELGDAGADAILASHRDSSHQDDGENFLQRLNRS